MIEIDATNDYAFRRTFGVPENIGALTSVFNAVRGRAGVAPAADLELLNPLIPGDVAGQKPGILDILVRDSTGARSAVEMQMLAHRAFQPRIHYYWAAKYRDQLPEGRDYHALRPVHAVLFLGWRMYPESPAAFHRFRPMDGATGLLFGDQMEILVVEMPKFPDDLADAADELDKWVWFLRNARGLDAGNLPEGLDMAEVARAARTLEHVSSDPAERARYESQRMYELDWATRLHDAVEDGRQRELRGEIRGELRGERRGVAKTLLDVLGRAGPTEAEMAAMTVEQLDELAIALRRELAAGRP